MGTVQDLSNDKNSNIPSAPSSPLSSSTSIYNPTGTSTIGGPSSVPVGTPSSGDVDAQGNVINQKTRIGDYVYSQGRKYVVPKSTTDIEKNKYVVHGGYNSMQNLNLTDVAGAVGSGIGQGLLSAAQGAGPLSIFYGLGVAFSDILDAQSRHAEEFLNQQIDYESAMQRKVDKDGKVYYEIDYDKIADAGRGSGKYIKDALDTTSTKAILTGDNSLSLTVSPTFAASDRYAELLERIKDYAPTLTVDEANEVIDDETGQTRLDMINEAVKQEEVQFYYNAQTFANLKKIAPSASDEALSDAASTQLIGSLNKKTLAQSEVVVYNKYNEKQTVNAKDYLDSIKNMNQEERNDYMTSIGNRIQDPTISDDEKAVLQAQANALYSASDNDGAYKGMFEKDFFDTVADTRTLIFGLRVGDVLPFLGPEELTTFKDNETIAPLLNLGTSVVRMLEMGKIMNGVEKILVRPAIQAIGSKFGLSFLADINKFAPQDIASPISSIWKANPAIGISEALGVKGFAKRTTGQLLTMGAADLMYETARAAAHGIAGEDFDFWSELGQDVAMDALMTYGPRNYLSAVNMPKYEYRRYDGDVTRKYEADEAIVKKADEIYENNLKDLYEDEFGNLDLYPKGTGIREYAGLVEITGKELAARHAERLDKLSNSKVALRVQELFMDKNAAMAKLAIQVKAHGGSDYMYHLALGAADDIKSKTADYMNDFKMFAGTEMDNMFKLMQEYAPGKKGFTQADADYVNAMQNQHRFLAENKGDKDAEAYITNFYKKAIGGVSEERAEQLNEMMTAMRSVANKVLDYYELHGLKDAKEIKRYRNHPAYKNGMFLPVWAKNAGINGNPGDIVISKHRADTKSVFNPEELIHIEDLENPITTLGEYIRNAAREVAINEAALAVREVASLPGMGIHVHEDTGGSLGEVTNLKEMSSKFKKQYDKIVDQVKAEYPSHQQWLKSNSDLVMNSQALAKTEELNVAKKEHSQLVRQRNKLQKAQEQAIADGPESVDVDNIRDQLVKLRTEKVDLIKKMAGKTGEEYDKLYAKREKVNKKIGKLEQKLGDAVFSGKAQAELLPEKENLDEIWVADPEVDAELKRLSKKATSLDDALGRFQSKAAYYAADEKGVKPYEPYWSIDDIIRSAVRKTLQNSFETGARQSWFDWDATKMARYETNRIVDYVDKAVQAKLEETPELKALDPLFNNKEMREANAKILQKVADDALKEAIDRRFTDEEKDAFAKFANQERLKAKREIINTRNEKLKEFEEAKPLIRNLGISSYLKIHEGSLAGAYGYYAPNGQRPVNGRKYDYNFIDDSVTGQTRSFVSDGAEIHVGLESLKGIYPSYDFQSTIMHEYAHAALDRAVNRVPIVQDLLGLLGVKGTISEKVANSRNATELVAYVTQKKFLDSIGKSEFSERFKDDSVVQRYLDAIVNEISDDDLGFENLVEPVTFKERFLNMLQIAVGFVKAKLLKLTDVDNFTDFYEGLVSGAFKDEMRISARNRPYSVEDTVTIPDLENGGWKEETTYSLDFHLDKVNIIALKMAEDIQKLQDKINANDETQARLTDEIKEEARKMLEEAQKMAKESPVELDLESFVSVKLTNALKDALKQNDAAGKIQSVLNEAVETANPYISRNSVIQARTQEAAKKFRKNLNAHLAFKSNEAKKKMGIDKLNAIADAAYDKIMEKVVGRRGQVSVINDAEESRILNSTDDHTIRYKLNGVEHRMTLTGKGSEALVKEFNNPEVILKGGPIKRFLNTSARELAQAKRYLTTSADISRVLPNLTRDWSRGIVTTGGKILISPKTYRDEVAQNSIYTSDKAKERIANGWKLVEQGVAGDTFTQSMMMPRKNRDKSMLRAMQSQDGNAFVRFKAKTIGEKLSLLQDLGEEFTRKRAAEVAYYDAISKASVRGVNIDTAIKEAVAAGYFAGRESTTNFFRRGELISKVAQMVPYLSQNFATLESFKYAYLDDPIAVGRSLKATVATYTALIAIAVSNEESRKKYYLLSEYDRANNIIIPLTNDIIMTIPLDETVAAFLTPYRRMVESLNGVDPEAFYLWGAEFLEALSPLDLTGFSEGDKFNVVRGLQKIGAQVVPTWALPFLEAETGTDWYYGSDIGVDEQYVGSRTGNYTPTAGELTTQNANSRTLATISDSTGIPQWILQRFVKQYGGNIGQYVLNTVDKLSGATEEEQGGKEFKDAIFKPFTGMDSDDASQAFWRGVKKLQERKTSLQNELRTLNGKIESSSGETKAELQNQRQEKIAKYGTDVSDFLSQYLSAYELTGGLTKKQANQIYWLYNLYDQNDNDTLYGEGTVEEYFSDKAQSSANKKATNLAARSGFDKFYESNGLTDYDTSYAMNALKNTIYGVPTQQMVDIANILEDTSDYANSFKKLRDDAKKARNAAYDAKNYDLADKIAYQYDYKVLSALYPYLVENGIAETLNRNAVINYLQDWILVPYDEMKTSKGRYVPNLGVDSQKYKAFVKQFVKKMYGVSGE